MPRSYVPQIRVRQPRAPLGAVRAQAMNPYRKHNPNGFEQGIADAAAALFRAPQEAASIREKQAADDETTRHNAANESFRQDRATKQDLFHAQEARWSHEDRQAATAARGAKATNAKGGPRMSPIPAFVTTRDDTGHVTGQRPLNDDELTGALSNQGRVERYGQIQNGVNPTNGQPLSAANPYHLGGDQPDELFTQASIGAHHGVQPAPAAVVAPGSSAGLFGSGDPAAQTAGDQMFGIPDGGAGPTGEVGAPEMPPELANFHEHVTGQPATPDDHAALDQIMPQVLGAVSKLHPHDQASFRSMLQNASADYTSGDKARAAAAMQRVQTAVQRLGIQVPGQLAQPIALAPSDLGAAPAQPGFGHGANAPRTMASDPFDDGGQ